MDAANKKKRPAHLPGKLEIVVTDPPAVIPVPRDLSPALRLTPTKFVGLCSYRGVKVLSVRECYMVKVCAFLLLFFVRRIASCDAFSKKAPPFFSPANNTYTCFSWRSFQILERLKVVHCLSFSIPHRMTRRAASHL